MKSKSLTALHRGGRIKRAGIVALVIGLACSAHATTKQVESLSQDFAYRILINPGHHYAPTFQTGAKVTQLDSIVLSIGLSVQIDPLPIEFTLPTLITSLYKANQDGTPNMAEPVMTQAFAYDSSQLIINQGIALSLTPTQPVYLEAGTTYSFIISANYTGVETGILLVTPVSLSANGYRKPEGGDWNLQTAIITSMDGGNTYQNQTPDGGYYPAFAIYTVPEPSTYALIGAGLALAFVAIKRRKR